MNMTYEGAERQLHVTLTAKADRIEDFLQRDLNLLIAANFVVVKTKRRRLKDDMVRVYITAELLKEQS